MPASHGHLCLCFCFVKQHMLCRTNNTACLTVLLHPKCIVSSTTPSRTTPPARKQQASYGMNYLCSVEQVTCNLLSSQYSSCHTYVTFGVLLGSVTCRTNGVFRKFLALVNDFFVDFASTDLRGETAFFFCNSSACFSYCCACFLCTCVLVVEFDR
jgi:hypothetical protein